MGSKSLVSKLLEEEEDDFTLPSKVSVPFVRTSPPPPPPPAPPCLPNLPTTPTPTPPNALVPPGISHQRSPASGSTSGSNTVTLSVGSFAVAVEQVVKAHADELQELRKSLQEQRDAYDKASLQWQKKTDELVFQNTKLKKEKNELASAYKKAQTLLENYKEKFDKLEAKIHRKSMSPPSISSTSTTTTNNNTLMTEHHEDKDILTSSNSKLPKHNDHMDEDDHPVGPNFLFSGKANKKRKSTDGADVIDIDAFEPVKVASTVQSVNLRHSGTSGSTLVSVQDDKATSSEVSNKTYDIIEQDTTGSFSQYSVVDVDEDVTPYNDTPVFTKTFDKKVQKVFGNGKQFKYVEPVRKKAERELLPGHECDQCQKWYDALKEGGILLDRKTLVNNCSRHKHLYEPPATPPDFWQVSFPESETQE